MSLSRKSLLKPLLFCLLLLPALNGLGQFTVNIQTDSPDANPGDGVCADAGGNCSLRAAIMEANALAGANEITLPIGEYVFSIAGVNEDNANTGDLDITGELNIVGEDTRQTIVRADSLDRVFDIQPGATVSIEHLEVWEGSVPNSNGGAIRNRGNLSLLEVGIRNSMCEGAGGNLSGGGWGGGIYNSGDLVLEQVTINSCLALGGKGANGVAPGGGSGGGAGPGMGGAIYNDQNASCTLVNSTFSGNTARGGRGGNGTFHQGSGTVASAGGSGGGFGGNGGGPNSAGTAGAWGGGGGGGGSIAGAGAPGGFGGGGGGGGASSWGGNAGPGGAAGLYGGNGGQGCCSAGSGGGGGAGLGGAIFNRSADLTITNCTFAFNQAIGGNGGSGWFSGPGATGQGKAGGLFNLAGTVTLNNSLLAQNTSSTDAPNLFGTFGSDSGHNLIQVTGPGMTLNGNTANNLLDVDPLILPLANNGGNTDTHFLESCNPVSPAIDAGNDAYASALDQIGQTRTNVSEIGAVEILALTVTLLPADTTLCFGATLLLDVTSDNSTYEWNDGSTDPSLLVDAEGLYTVTVTQNGCDYYDEINVMYNPLESVDLGPDVVICPGSNALLDATFPGATYEWQDGSTLPTYDATEDGTYTVIVTLEDCSATGSVDLSFVDDPGLDLGPDQSLCEGEEAVLTSNVVADSYSWSNGESDSEITATTTDEYTLEIEVNGCVFSSSVNVEFAPLPVVDLGEDLELCEGETITLDVSGTPGSYDWQDGSADPQFEVSEDGIYAVTITLGNCSASDELEIIFIPLPVFDLGEDIEFCDGESAQIGTDVLADAYFWNTGQQSDLITVDETGDYTLELEWNGCTFSDEIHVEVHPAPVVNLGPNQQLCEGDEVVLDVSDIPGTYEWQNGSGASSITVTQTGTYSVTVNSNGCEDSDEVVLTFNPVPIFDLGEDETICYNGDFELIVETGLDNVEVSWNNGQSGPVITPAVSGNYIATAELGVCAFTDQVEITIIPPIELELGADRLACADTEVRIETNLEGFPYPLSFEWSNEEFSPFIEVTQSNTYEVTVESECESVSDFVQVQFEQCGCLVYVPIAFTPNNDGVNDYFEVVTECDFEAFLLQIFDRNGQLIFESSDASQIWDGSYNGGDYYVQDGIYAWRIEYTSINIDGIVSETLQGHVTFLR